MNLLHTNDFNDENNHTDYPDPYVHSLATVRISFMGLYPTYEVHKKKARTTYGRDTELFI
jgi:hypothetical protein